MPCSAEYEKINSVEIVSAASMCWRIRKICSITLGKIQQFEPPQYLKDIPRTKRKQKNPPIFSLGSVSCLFVSYLTNSNRIHLEALIPAAW